MTQTHHLSGAKPLSRSDAAELLKEVISTARGHDDALIVFDLDSTLLDNSPRQALILREYGEQIGHRGLAESTPEKWGGWDFRIPMTAAGLSKEEMEEHLPKFRAFWLERFFTSEYCRVDQPIPGAPEYVQAVFAADINIAYVTGRHEGMREGSLVSFKQGGFPMPNGKHISLLMKPSLDVHDDDYKVGMHKQLGAMGRVTAAFDNEPTHINDYRSAFPEARAIHLATDCSLRGIQVEDGIPSIVDFASFAD